MNRSIDITVLCDNRPLSPEFRAEHGLSFHFATPAGEVLFDTGQSDVFLHNAKALACSLEEVDALVLSHGHYDHTGGLAWAGNRFDKALHYFHPQLLEKHFRALDDGTGKDIGIPEAAFAHLSRPDIHSVHTITPTEILPGIWVTGEVPRLHAYEDRGGPFFTDEACTLADEINDDQALWIESPAGLVVLLGCAHAGTINTLDYISQLNPGKKIRALLGGMHLKSASEQRMDQTRSALRRYEIDFLAPCHCTGEEVMASLEKHFPKSFRHCLAGSRFSFPL